MQAAIASLLSLILASGIIAGGFLGGRYFMRWLNQPQDDGDRVMYELVFPAELPTAQVQAWLRSVVGSLGHNSLVFETLAVQGSITYYLGIPRAHEAYVLAQLRAQLPEMHALPVDPDIRRWSLVVEYGEHDPRRLLRIPSVEETAAAFIGALRGLGHGQTVSTQLVISPAMPRDVPESPPEPLKTGNMFVDAALRNMATSKTAHKEAREKSQEPNVHAVMRVAVHAQDASAGGLLQNVERAYMSVRGNGNGLTRLGNSTPDTVGRYLDAAPMRKWPATFTLTELSALMSWPLGASRIPEVKQATTRHMWADGNIPTSGVVLARSTVPGNERPLALTVDDLMQHMHVIGKTGSGKTTLILNILAQLMADKRKPGFAFIDPHGDAAKSLLDLVPADRLDDVIYFDPTDTDSPVGLNLMRGKNPATITSYLTGVLEGIYGSGIMSGHVLRNTIQTVAEHGDMTLYEVALALNDSEFRNELIASVTDEHLKRYWTRYKSLSAAQQAQDTEPAMRRLSPLLTPELRNIFAQGGGIDMKAVMDSGKILIVNLSSAQLGESNSSLLGALIVARLWQETLQRAAIPENERRPFILCADEFQRFMHLPTSFGDVLAEARKFKLGCILSHQLMKQIKDIQDDVMANARNKVALTVEAKDAAMLAKEIGVEARDIQHLGAHEMILSIVHNNRPSHPATGKALEPPASVGLGEKVRFKSRARYGIPADHVALQMELRRKRKTSSKRLRPKIGRE